VMSLDTGDYEWIHFTPEIDLGGFEKIHSGWSSDSYILRSISDPRIHMGVKKEEFFKSLLKISARDTWQYTPRILICLLSFDSKQRTIDLITF
jgi:hypothetical protein